MLYAAFNSEVSRVTWISENQAKEIAANFLQQNYSVLKVEKPVLKEEIWIVDILVSSPSRRKFKVQINAKTGHVMSF